MTQHRAGRPLGAAGDWPVQSSSAAAGTDLLEPLVEREPVRIARGPGSAARAEAGAALLAAFDDARLAAHVRPRSSAALPARSSDPLAPSRRRARRSRPGVGSAWCGCSAAAPWPTPSCVRRGARSGAARPAGLAGRRRRGRTRALLDAADRGWPGTARRSRRRRAATTPGSASGWSTAFGCGAGATVLAAPAHGGGEIDWHSLRRRAGRST